MAGDHWGTLSTYWSLLGPPLRPSPEDVAVAASVVRAWREAHAASPLRALILGVTPELATLPWPRGTTLVAVDRSAAMVGAIWPREAAPPGSTAVVGDWRALALPDASVDLALGDGCFTVIEYPGDYRAVTRELRRVLRPGGRLVVRAFTRPEIPEDVTDVARALREGEVRGLQALKWRLAMAVQPRHTRAVAVVDVWRAFHAMCPDPSRLLLDLGATPEHLTTVEIYRDSPAVYSYPTLAELRAELAADFEELSCHVPAYELGERCPTLVLSPRPHR